MTKKKNPEASMMALNGDIYINKPFLLVSGSFIGATI